MRNKKLATSVALALVLGFGILQATQFSDASVRQALNAELRGYYQQCEQGPSVSAPTKSDWAQVQERCERDTNEVVAELTEVAQNKAQLFPVWAPFVAFFLVGAVLSALTTREAVFGVGVAGALLGVYGSLHTGTIGPLVLIPLLLSGGYYVSSYFKRANSA